MLRNEKFVFVCLTMLGLAIPNSATTAEPLSPAQAEFFETRIRPVLVERCYECHNSTKSADGGLAVDQRSAFLKGGDSGVVIVPGKPEQSRLMAILRHEVAGVKMPKDGGKLEPNVLADFEKWIALGAPDPRDKPPSVEELTKATSFDTVIASRKQWWSFQSIKSSPPPVPADGKAVAHPIDQFVRAKLNAGGLKANEPADPQTLVRRLFFALTGLPPSAADVEAWGPRVAQPNGIADLVNHLLDSPQYGERWTRHWMDWVRYADSHGSEGDPAIDNSSQYRDYLIRALNADVPYDQLVREHVAGDLLEKPRINWDLGINESVIGTAHWRMVFHGFAPTDALDERVRFTDDAINTFSKAFLALTVSCARCHDHKFDPISQKDYYALFGVIGSCRPGRVAIDTPEKLNANREELTRLKPQIRMAIADAWLDGSTKVKASLSAPDGPWKKADKPTMLLHPWFVMQQDTAGGTSFADAWQKQVTSWKNDRQQRGEHQARNYWRHWNLADKAEYEKWYRVGNGLPEKPSLAGEFALAANGKDVLAGIYPAGVFTNSLSAKHAARLSSNRVRLDDNYELWLQVIGDPSATARYVVEDYPRDGTVFPVAALSNEWQWKKLDLTYWNGDEFFVELTSGKDAPLLVKGEPRSWFGVRDVLIVRKGDPGPPVASREFLDAVFESAADAAPQSFDDLADCYQRVVMAAVNAWRAGSLNDAQARLLDACLKQGLLPNQTDDFAAAKPLIQEYRRLEEAVVVPTRVPGLEETVGRNQPLYTRGNHKQPAAEVPRRFLEAIDATPYQTTQSGRRQLAEDLLRPDNPLTRRVIVNRVWHHLFGRGIVTTCDNFGRLGSEPTHPELLDYLADRFRDEGWSLKQMIRFIVTSRTWQQSSHPSATAEQVDPDNRLLSHAFLHRLEAEAIRDSLLAVSGELNRGLSGGLTDGNSNRRSVYVRVTRNALDPFLRAFDFPEPFAAVGRRDVTNVPAQSLTMMNDPRVTSLAASWAGQLLADPKTNTDELRIQKMFVTALSRAARSDEIDRFQAHIAETKLRHLELLHQARELRTEIDRERLAIQRVVEPKRQMLLRDAQVKVETGELAIPKPIGRWEFESDLQDSVGPAHGEARGDARIERGALVVKQQGYVVTSPLKQAVKAKTIEAWVQLADLDQRGGGVITIQSTDGGIFDSIVFGEQNPRQWMAGSNFFQRTQSFNAPPEQDAVGRPVHVAIAYHEDGLIVGYRDGQPYGKPYKSSGPVEFPAGRTIMGFGIRHLPAGGNHMLSGRILRAQLYDRALSADEIAATSQSAAFVVSESKINAALSSAEREQIEQSRLKIRDLESKIEALGPLPDANANKALWTNLTHAMFTFQEFIYLK